MGAAGGWATMVGAVFTPSRTMALVAVLVAAAPGKPLGTTAKQKLASAGWAEAKFRVAEVAPGMATPTLVLKPLNHCTVWVVPAMVMAAGTIVREAGVPATTLVATGWVVMAALWYRVTVHTELVVLSVLPAPTVLVTTTRYFWALPVGKAGAWKLDELVPVLLKVAPPSVETCHWKLRVPPAGAEALTEMVLLVGLTVPFWYFVAGRSAVITGAASTFMTIAAEVAVATAPLCVSLTETV